MSCVPFPFLRISGADYFVTSEVGILQQGPKLFREFSIAVIGLEEIANQLEGDADTDA